MTLTTTLEYPAEIAEGSQLDFGPLLLLLIVVLYLLLDDHLNGRLGAAIRDAGEGTDQGTADRVARTHEGNRATEDAGWRPSDSSQTGPPELRVGPRGSLSPLGEELLKIREEIMASGEPLLSWDGLEREIAERRGEVA